jgi:ribosomal protein S18 acetylase RimI-like enzyme
MKVTIRQFKDGSGSIKKDNYLEAYSRLFNDRECLKYLSFTGIPFSDLQLRQWIARAEADGVEYRCAVDGETDSIVGIAITRAEPAMGFEIIGVAVDPRCKRKGIGRRLIDEAVGRAAKKGYSAVDVALYADNKAMLSLLVGADFKPVRMEYHKRYDGEDLVWMKKALRGWPPGQLSGVSSPWLTAS